MPFSLRVEIPVWPRAYGGPSGRGTLRSIPGDFIVDESLSFEPAGEGEHVLLSIRKTGENTEYVARQLARFAGVRQRDIGYAGLKDRQAITTQWFSVWLPGKDEPDWRLFDSETMQIVQTRRHCRKLKRGALSGNRFAVRIRGWHGDENVLEQQLNRIKTQGMPNYFGAQRFGREGRNVDNALAMFEGARVKREQRSLYLSAVRAFLFNRVAAARIERNDWNTALDGDLMMLDRSHSLFRAEFVDDELIRRSMIGEIHPTGSLPGRHTMEPAGTAAEIEQTALEEFADLIQALIDEGLDSARRSLRVNASDLEWQFIDADLLQLTFTLPAGSFATALLREIIDA